MAAANCRIIHYVTANYLINYYFKFKHDIKIPTHTTCLLVFQIYCLKELNLIFEINSPKNVLGNIFFFFIDIAMNHGNYDVIQYVLRTIVRRRQD